MTKIGLIGARGSGKSAFSQALAKETGSTILDEYVEDFQKQTGLAAAQYGTYIVNMEIAMYRLVLEQEHFKGGSENRDLITCGTLLDTSIYLALNAAALANTGQGNFENNLAQDKRSNATMHWFGMMRTDAWQYDHTFYLPLGDKRDPEKDSVAAIFDDHVIEACETFRIPFFLLDQSSEEERVAAALKYIEEGNANEAATK